MRATGYAISTSLLATFRQQSEQFNQLSTHHAACNFVGEYGTILAFVTPLHGNGPFHIVVSPTLLTQIKAQPQLQLRAGNIKAGSLTLALHDLARWEPHLPPLRHPPRQAFTLLHNHYQNTGQPALGFVQLPQDDLLTSTTGKVTKPVANTPATHYTRRTQRAITALWTGLHEERSALMRLATELLAGLGPGLTPAGDDFLVGLLAAMYALGPHCAQTRWVRLQRDANQIARVAAPRTTQLSAAWLTAAGTGAFGEAWHHLLHALNGERLPVITEAANRILATGATSGADALGGFLFGVRVLEEKG